MGLWQTSTTDCCARHKVGPLFSALEAYDTWFTGLRREQSPSRASLEPVEDFRLPSGKHLMKISPLAMWTTKDVWSYAKAHDIPLLPLYDAGYSSIGCEPCTTVPLDPLNPRSGRWGGQKLECGIHIQPVDSEIRRIVGNHEMQPRRHEDAKKSLRDFVFLGVLSCFRGCN